MTPKENNRMLALDIDAAAVAGYDMAEWESVRGYRPIFMRRRRRLRVPGPSVALLVIDMGWPLPTLSGIRDSEHVAHAINRVAATVRRAGGIVIHAPSGVDSSLKSAARDRADRAADEAFNFFIHRQGLPAEYVRRHFFAAQPGDEYLRLDDQTILPVTPDPRIAIDGERDYLTGEGMKVHSILRRHDVRHVLVAGQSLPHSLMSSPYGVLRLADFGYVPILLEDAVATAADPWRNVFESGAEAKHLLLRQLARLGVGIARTTPVSPFQPRISWMPGPLQAAARRLLERARLLPAALRGREGAAAAEFGSAPVARSVGAALPRPEGFELAPVPPRAHGRRCALDEDILLDNRSDGFRFLESGWSEVEPWGVWSDGPEAGLVLYPYERLSPVLELRFDANSPWGLQPSGERLRFSVSVNGAPIARDMTHEGDGMQSFAARFPATLLPADRRMEVRFDFHNPWPEPSGRRLGVGLVRMALRRVVE